MLARRLAGDGCGWPAGRTGRPGSGWPIGAPAPWGTRISSRAWSTRVGAATCRASSLTSIWAHDSRSRAAFSADEVRRSSSANDSHSSGGASGMKLEVKNRRNAGSSRPHPRRTISTCRAASRRCSLVVARRSPLDVGAAQHQVADPLRDGGPRRRPRPRHLGKRPAAGTGRDRGRRRRSPGPAPRRRARSRRRHGRRGRSRARRSARTCAGGPARRASGATPGSASRSRGG